MDASKAYSLSFISNILRSFAYTAYNAKKHDPNVRRRVRYNNFLFMMIRQVRWPILSTLHDDTFQKLWLNSVCMQSVVPIDMCNTKMSLDFFFFEYAVRSSFNQIQKLVIEKALIPVYYFLTENVHQRIFLRFLWLYLHSANTENRKPIQRKLTFAELIIVKSSMVEKKPPYLRRKILYYQHDNDNGKQLSPHTPPSEHRSVSTAA